MNWRVFVVNGKRTAVATTTAACHICGRLLPAGMVVRLRNGRAKSSHRIACTSHFAGRKP